MILLTVVGNEMEENNMKKMENNNELDISKIAYDLYCQNWMDTNLTREMKLDTIRNYYRYKKECIDEGFEFDIFEEWAYDSGYGHGNIFVCYDEFCDMEYHDKEFISNLLNDKDLIELYYHDIDDDVKI